MSSTLSTIQTITRWEARDDNLDLTQDEGLAIANMMYRRMTALLPWGEMVRTDTSLTTTSGTEAYTWPSTNTYLDVQNIEIQDATDNDKYKIVVPARSELIYNKYREEPSGFPVVYRRMHDGSNNKLYLAPKPNESNQTIRITGLAEPTAFTNGNSTTVFVTTNADYALAYLIAADVSDKRAQPQRAASLLSKTSEILSGLAGREITPFELRDKVLNA